MMQTPIAKSNVLRRLALGGVALAVTASTGCKTAPSLPGASLFGWKKTPSAETLAGQGPTTTYPSAPSTAFTPNAIASNAAGTAQGSPSTSLNPSDIATGVPTTAAQANGFTGLASNGTPATGYGATPGTASPAGYTATPPSYAQIPPTPSSAQSSNIPSYAAATQPSPTRSTQGLYGNGPTSIPPSASPVPNYAPSSYTASAPAAQVADAASSPSYGTSGSPSYPTPATYGAPSATPAATPGYSTPNYSVPPTSPYSAPSSAPYTTPSTGSTSGTTSGYATPGYAAPTGYVTGNGAPTTPYTVPQTSSASPTSSPAATPATGYRPGSTSNATSYPSTPYTTPSGSVYR